ncbi:MAG: hypothetical protein RBR54_06860 [Sulfurimonas sp.]|jgi:hypothetical protein|nr:hypothetical protein [Sulfurimonas sp.]
MPRIFRISKTKFAFTALAFLLMGSLLVALSPDVISTDKSSACPAPTKLISEDFEGKAVCQISGIVSQDLTLTNDKFWALSGEVHIGIDRTKKTELTIQEGTTLFGKTEQDFLVINRGSKILAQGTKEQPIVFTSRNDAAGLVAKAGEWGGIVIAGEAGINADGGENSFEFSTTPIYYGGSDDEDSSGVLRYVLVKYAGHIVYTAKELNGISFGGVGRGTEIDYVEVYKGKDDGIELWGGTVNLKHIVLIDNGDDNLDIDEGYRGNIQYLYSSQDVEDAFYARALEGDNNADDPLASPRTAPIISNFTFIGGGYASEGVVLKKGGGATLLNGVIQGFEQTCLGLEDESTLANKAIQIDAVTLLGCEKNHAGKRLDQEKVDALFAQSSASYVSPKSYGSFFEETNYRGAYEEANDWRAGWSKLY